MAAIAYPAGWKQLANIPEDRDDVQKAFELLKDTYPPGQYNHLNVRRLRRKMVCRENSAGDLVLGLRIFVRPDTSGANLHMTAFYFVRLRAANEEYAVTFGIGSAVPETTITPQIKAINGYMAGQPGGARRVLLTVTQTPTTNRTQLDLAFTGAVANGALVLEGQILPDPPPWPNGYYVYRFVP